MDQNERRKYLITYLQKEHTGHGLSVMPSSTTIGAERGNPTPDITGQKRLLRALMNVRPPMEISAEFLKVQDEYLKEVLAERETVSIEDLEPLQEGVYLWQGDITRLSADAIVNAANSGMTGCYQPNHSCIDNCIHTYAGIQLRLACAELMAQQGYEEPTGQAKITPAFNLPCKYVLHTVGPIVGRNAFGQPNLQEEHCRLLASCYRSCLELAEENHCKSIAFCCISTGVFGFPNREAAEIAIRTVREYQSAKTVAENKIEVIFNVFKDEDYEIYRELLG